MLRQPLAIAFFLLSHDTFTGRLQVSGELLACGLVGAQLGELMLEGRLAIVGGRVAVTGRRGNGTDALSEYVIDSIARQPETHVVRTWTDNLGPMLVELVARQVVDEGIVRHESGGGLLRRRSDRYPALDLVRAVAGRVRVEHGLRRPEDLDLRVGFLAALVFVVGAEGVLDPAVDRTAARELADEIAEDLPRSLHGLIEGLRGAAAAISLRVRR